MQKNASITYYLISILLLNAYHPQSLYALSGPGALEALSTEITNQSMGTTQKPAIIRESFYANVPEISRPADSRSSKPLIPSESPSDLYREMADKENDIPLTEDLMREHGILNRVLLIYEEVIRRIDANALFPAALLEQAAQIIKSFIEEYHEKMEEDYLFPLFEKQRKEVKLVRTLKQQHVRGREITNSILSILSTNKTGLSAKQKKMIKNSLQKFITMYRPHEARENTVLFPLVRSLMSEKEFIEMGEKFDALEHKLFGENGFESIVGKVAAIEKELGIYNLEQFTPEPTTQPTQISYNRPN